MGCNLCTLQKREEHYKLLYEITQVNGRDLSKAGQEEAVEAMRKDPIVVQVLQRSPASCYPGNLQEVGLVDVCTQTDITFEHIMALTKLRPATPPVPDVCPFLLSDSCHSIHTMEHEYYECPEYLSNNQAEIERTDDFEYEEVELCRLNSEEKLGLTLCYRTDDEEDAAIYVSQIGPNSIAARDGRIREGDRILQINGRDVQNREEAVALLSNEDSRSIVLLVTRPETQVEEGWLDEEHNDFLEELKMEILEEQRKEEIHKTTSRAELRRPEEDAVTTDTATYCSSNAQDKDSGVQESSEHEAAPPLGRWRPPHHRLRERQETEPGLVAMETMHLTNQETMVGGSEAAVECDRFQRLLELKCRISNSGECGLVYRHSRTIECSVTEQGGGVEHELRLLNEELRSIERECQSIMQAHQLRTSQRASPRQRRGKLADITEQPERASSDRLLRDSSSAYNTAESSRSTPMGMEGSPDHSVQRHVSLTNQKNLRSNLSIHSSPSQGHPTSDASPTPTLQTPPSPGPHGSGSQCLNSSSLEQSPSNPSESDPALPADDERQDHRRTRRNYSSPYHHQPTSSSQSRHYQSYLQLLQQHSSSSLEYSQSLLSLRGPSRPGQPRLEWKVKVRSDGTRYVARRPARDRILRERALRIREERSGGMTTDDDAVSELKMGRYWSKEERKQQLARAREQRRRREFMQRCRLEGPREQTGGGVSGTEPRKEVNILELSQRKMMKKRNKKILDNWMTIQELMTHGARASEGTKVHNAFLSVTTV
ncbi:PDZ domain-containing RING finger protein 4 [Chanos chanos]|uniref:PDZ domain-containing RING finger protein 4 n=1 Tax=Chanos chanos TaxID=29144 RepID=A0A6J2W5F0_CHACN|nr:PDZ domain-containing RING finger protein 4-like [Chanos chanos]